jgi:ubiquinone/menaquinone biosynthesis C-methylase UbiE
LPVLGSHFKDLVGRYHGPEGDAFALEELAPVASRFLDANSKILEVGCGYGRNLMAVASLKPGMVVGSDVDAGELQRSAAKRSTLPPEKFTRIELVQQEPRRLPFRDGTFDMVVLWQVLEHLFGQELKQTVVSECVRVLKPGGVVLVETPNQWFPVDYHDNKLPLVHWLLPLSAREWLTHRVRGMKYHPSEYVSLGSCKRLFRSAPNVRSVRKETRVYFARSFNEAWRGLAGTQVAAKRVLFALAWPYHVVSRLWGGSADSILPSLRVVWRVEKSS